MRDYVIAFVGDHANNILRWWTGKILDGLARHGLDHVLIDFTANDWRDQLADCMAGGNPLFVFAFQGFAMDVRLENENFWARNDIPFLAYLGDSPYHSPGLHAAEGPGLYLLYGCEDFLHTYRHILNGRAYATTLPYGYPENPAADLVPWAHRAHDLVFAKTGIDPARLRQGWAGLPAVTRAIIEDSAAHVLTGSDDTVTTTCAAAFDDRSIHWGERRELFLFVASTVDRYARAVRADRMVRALLHHDALIVGDWPHIDTAGARARFHAPVAADTLDALYADSRIVVNTSPTVRRGMHERIMAGLFAKAAVLSDTTPFLQRTLHGCPAFIGLDIDHADFPAAADHAVHATLGDDEMPARAAASAEFARSHFSFDDFILRLLDHVGIERHRRTLVAWSFPPPPHRPPVHAAAGQE